MAEWIKDKGAIPDIPGLTEELTQVQYSFKGDKIILEPKDELKKRISRSPDLADALAVTFAFKIVPKKQILRNLARPSDCAEAWDPMEYL
jgi:hypothetical protein